MTSADIPAGITSQSIAVKDSTLHYLEAGSGDPIVFLHGNPTSSYLWRNVIPHVAAHGRCLAVDLIGMGRSGKPLLAYRLVEHIAYLDAFIDALDLTRIVFVGHDWGVAIALHYLRRFPERVRAVAFMEGHIHPIASWDNFDAGGRAIFGALRTEKVGRKLAIDENFFIETVLPSGIQRTLTSAEMAAYRAPYLAPRIANRSGAGRTRSRSRDTPPMSTRSSATIRPPSPPHRCPSFSATPHPARSSAPPRSPGAAKTSAISPPPTSAPAATSSPKTTPSRSGRRSGNGWGSWGDRIG